MTKRRSSAWPRVLAAAVSGLLAGAVAMGIAQLNATVYIISSVLMPK